MCFMNFHIVVKLEWNKKGLKASLVSVHDVSREETAASVTSNLDIYSMSHFKKYSVFTYTGNLAPYVQITYKYCLLFSKIKVSTQ